MSFKQLFPLAFALLLTACGSHAPAAATLALGNPLMAHHAPVPAAAAPGADAPAPVASAAAAAASVVTMGFPRFTLKNPASGQQGDPVNLLLAASQGQLERLFADAGWLEADPITPLSIAHMLTATLDRSLQYPRAPMSNLYLYNRHQDYAYEKNCVGVRQRDHLRVWQTNQLDRLARPLWAIAATKDVAIEWVDHHPTHRIDPAVDAERALVASDLSASGRLALSYSITSLPGGYTGTNGEGDPFTTDGQVTVLELTADAPARLGVVPRTQSPVASQPQPLQDASLSQGRSRP